MKVKGCILFFLMGVFFQSKSFAYTAMTLPGSLFSVLQEPKIGFGSKSEVGMAFYEGNTNTNLTSLSEELSYRWSEETVQLLGQFLEQNADDKLKAQRWKIGLRYERRLIRHLGVFVGEGLEGNRFSGYLQRYSSDLGFRYVLKNESAFKVAIETGFRHQTENQLNGSQVRSVIARFFFETAYQWNEGVNTVLATEYLPVVDDFANWRMGAEADINVNLSRFLVLKTAYGIRYASEPPSKGVKNTDRSFITSLVANF